MRGPVPAWADRSPPHHRPGEQLNFDVVSLVDGEEVAKGALAAAIVDAVPR